MFSSSHFNRILKCHRTSRRCAANIKGQTEDNLATSIKEIVRRSPGINAAKEIASRRRTARIGRGLKAQTAICRNRIDRNRIQRHRKTSWRVRNICNQDIGCTRRAKIGHANVVIQRLIKPDRIICRRIGFDLGDREIKLRRVNAMGQVKEVVAGIGIIPAIGIERTCLNSRAVGDCRRSKREFGQNVDFHLAQLIADELAKSTRDLSCGRGNRTNAARLGRCGRSNNIEQSWVNDIGDYDIFSRIGTVIADTNQVSRRHTHSHGIGRYTFVAYRHVGNSTNGVTGIIAIVAVIDLSRIDRENCCLIEKAAASKRSINPQDKGLRRKVCQIVESYVSPAIARLITECWGGGRGETFKRNAGCQATRVYEVRENVANTHCARDIAAPVARDQLDVERVDIIRDNEIAGG